MMAPVQPSPAAPASDERVRPAGVSRTALRIVAWVWLAILIAGSLQPARPSLVKGFHREIHWIGFAGAALLLLALSRNRLREILGACTIFLLGVSLEVLQHLLYRSHMEWRDIGDDGFAILLALALYLLTGAWKPRPDPLL